MQDGGDAPRDEAMPGRAVPRPGVLRPRYRRRVGPAHVRERVAIRHLTDEPGRGPVPTDVVGRLLGLDDDVLIVVDRASSLHVIDAASVLSSRVVPPHPRLEPEPDVGTRDAPLVREAARALVLDDEDRVLLLAHLAGDGSRVWTAPGGGLHAGEDHPDATRREVREELGVEPEVGPWVWSRRVTFAFRGVWLDQSERWFLVRLPNFEASEAPLADPLVGSARWFSPGELARCPDRLAPRELATHLAVLLRSGPPPQPVDVGE